MVLFENPNLELEEDVTFEGLPDDVFDGIVAGIDHELEQQMRYNEIQEAESIAFAAKFSTTL